MSKYVENLASEAINYRSFQQEKARQRGIYMWKTGEGIDMQQQAPDGTPLLLRYNKQLQKGSLLKELYEDKELQEHWQICKYDVKRGYVQTEERDVTSSDLPQIEAMVAAVQELFPFHPLVEELLKDLGSFQEQHPYEAQM